MEELGKALTDTCRAVRELSNKKQKKQEGTRDRNTNSEQLEFECQLKTPDSWSLSHLGLYPGTTPVTIKLDHNRSCPWV